MIVKELYDTLARLPADAPVILRTNLDTIGTNLIEVREDDGEVVLFDEDTQDDCDGSDDDDPWADSGDDH